MYSKTEREHGTRVALDGRVDKYVLYQRSVQDAPVEVNFFDRVYRNLRGKEPLVLREDFCGTALVTCEWVKRGGERRSYGIDLHAPTLRWGRKHNMAPLGKAAARVNLICGNVLDGHPFKADMAVATNFSYFTFKDRPTMLRYARGIRRGLAPDGIFVLDIFGGPDAQIVQEEETNHGDFVYIWDQAYFNPVNSHIRCFIHFKLPKGRMMHRAFSYDWRLWSIPEMTDVLQEAGFRDVEIYWEGTQRSTGEGNGIFRRTTRGDDSAAWIAYIVAVK